MEMTFDEALSKWIEHARKVFGDTYTLKYSSTPRYVKIVASSNVGRSESVYCFIDSDTWDVWKPASSAGPIRNKARGNLHDLEEAYKWIGKYGIGSLR